MRNGSNTQKLGTYDIFPDVLSRKKCVLGASRVITQIVTDHGNFRDYLARIGKEDSHDCPECLVRDTIKHRVEECIRWEIWRLNLWHHMPAKGITIGEVVRYCLSENRIAYISKSMPNG
jgi:hypothetical protein